MRIVNKNYQKDMGTYTNVRGKKQLRVEKLVASHEPDWEDLWAAGRI